jgi:hypothetical protein
MNMELILLCAQPEALSTNFQETGWLPFHVVARDETGHIIGVVPLYLKRFNIINRIASIGFLFAVYSMLLSSYSLAEQK